MASPLWPPPISGSRPPELWRQGSCPRVPWPARGQLVRDRTALLLAFMLAVAVPRPLARSIRALQAGFWDSRRNQSCCSCGFPSSPRKQHRVLALLARSLVSTGLDRPRPGSGRRRHGRGHGDCRSPDPVPEIGPCVLGFSGGASRYLRKGSSPNSDVLGATGRDPGRSPDRRDPTLHRWNARTLVLGDPGRDRPCCGLCLERRRLHGRASGVHRIRGGSICILLPHQGDVGILRVGDIAIGGGVS